MSEVRINYDRVFSSADGFVEAAKIGQQLLNEFKSPSVYLGDHWMGRASENYKLKYVSLYRNINSEIELLENLGKSIRTIAEKYKAQDEDGGFFSDLWNGIKDVAGDIVGGIEGLLGDVGGVVGSVVSGVGKAIDGIEGLVKDVGSSIGSAVSWVADKVKDIDWDDVGHAVIGAAQAAGSVLLTPYLGPAAPLVCNLAGNFLNSGLDELTGDTSHGSGGSDKKAPNEGDKVVNAGDASGGFDLSSIIKSVGASIGGGGSSGILGTLENALGGVAGGGSSGFMGTIGNVFSSVSSGNWTGALGSIGSAIFSLF